jgi:Asp-tRNA(Asn)/Glu-tRNA(Gln) amidotransferase A subunit family amidase
LGDGAPSAIAAWAVRRRLAWLLSRATGGAASLLLVGCTFAKSKRKGTWTSWPLASATRLAADVRDRRVGCLELLDHFLARAERYNPALNAIVAWQIDGARDRARAADAPLARGEVRGPLHGVPMTVKESFNVTGLPTTWGNPLWKENIATENAVVIERLVQAGAIIYGKTNVPLNRYTED